MSSKSAFGPSATSVHKLPMWLLPTPPRTDEPAVGVIKPLLLRIMAGEHLSRAEAAELLEALLSGDSNDAQIAAALVALAIKGETVEELAGMAEAMRARAIRLKCRHPRFIDTAGTGSSYAKTYNVSTAAAFVIAGAGLPVAKHGSRAATSRSGSADLLTELGVNVNAPPEVSERCLNDIGICFMFAPLYHAATARVAAVRRQLGVHTTFNLLGPLTNPAGAPRQVIGVWHPALLEHVARTLAALGSEKAWVVRGEDGLDEITVAAMTRVVEVENGRVTPREIGPADFGLRSSRLDDLRGGDAKANARIVREVLEGERDDAARDLAIANAAAALYVGGTASDLRAAAEMAAESIASGRALEKLNQLSDATRAAQV